MQLSIAVMFYRHKTSYHKRYVPWLAILPKTHFFAQDWPVDADWLKTKLYSILCGSTKEVYETGSQVADLHLMLSTMISNKTTGTCGTRLKDAVHRACFEGFPDLAREMGLGFLGRDNVDGRLSTEGREDQVSLLWYSCGAYQASILHLERKWKEGHTG